MSDIDTPGQIGVLVLHSLENIAELIDSIPTIMPAVNFAYGEG